MPRVKERPAQESLDTVKSRTLIRAAEIVGGVGLLGAYLSAPQAELMAWMAGLDEPPAEKFLLAVDLLLEDSENHGMAS